MQAGRISAGNALHLARFLHEERWDGAERWLRSVIEEANAAQCDRLLLSSEWLLGGLARTGRLERLDRLARRWAGESIQLLMILRDPVGQFLSLYKHRAKSGNVASIDQWAESGYDLPLKLRELRAQIEASGVRLQVRAYGKQPGSLERLFFETWLNVSVPAHSSGLLVNPSLSLSELVLLRKLRERDPDLVPFLYERLLEVDPADKEEGREMLDFARSVAADTVAGHAEEWSHWNALMPEADRFVIPDAGPATDEEPKRLTLSDAQMAAVMSLLASAVSRRFRWQLFWRSRLRPALARVKRVLFPWHSRR